MYHFKAICEDSYLIADEEAKVFLKIILKENITVIVDAFKPLDNKKVLHYYFDFKGNPDNTYETEEEIKEETRKGKGKRVQTEITKPFVEYDEGKNLFLLGICSPFTGVPVVETYFQKEKNKKNQPFWINAIWSPEDGGASFPALFFGKPF